MPIRIQAPDGTIAEFPDGTSDATIEQVMKQTYGGPQSAPDVGFGAGVRPPDASTGRGVDVWVGDDRMPTPGAAPEAVPPAAAPQAPAMPPAPPGAPPERPGGLWASNIEMMQSPAYNLPFVGPAIAALQNGGARAFSQGVPVLGAYADEANAATNAALAPTVEPLLRKLEGWGINTGYDDRFRLDDKKTFAERYDAARAIEKPLNTDAVQDRPEMMGGGALVGTVGLLPYLGGMSMRAAGSNLLTRTGVGALEGGLAGGAQGYGSGEGGANDPSRFGDAAKGAALGAGVGGALPTVGDGLAMAWNAGKNTLGRDVSPYLGDAIDALENADEAAPQLAEILAAIKARPQVSVPPVAMEDAYGRIAQAMARQGMDPQQLADATRAVGPHGVIADTGEAMRDLTKAATNRPGSASEIARTNLDIRQKGILKDGEFEVRPSSLRVLDDAAQGLGVEGKRYHQEFAAIDAAQREAAQPAYDLVRGYGELGSPKLEELATRPSVKEAMKRARRIAREDGKDPDALGLADVENMDQWANTPPPEQQTVREALEAAAKRGPAKAPSRGPSLVKFIADGGGMKDAGGELSAMDGELWNYGKAFQRKLIGQADTADGWALRAWEAGYFPEFAERPTERQLIDAIDKELRGTKRFAREADQGAADRMRLRDQADEMIYRGGGQDAAGGPEDYVGRPEPKSEPAMIMRPTLETWDYVKQGLDDVLEDYRNPITGKLDLDTEGSRIKNTAQQVRNELIRLTGGTGGVYKQALDAYAGPASLKTAMEAGRRALNVDEEQIGMRLADMGPSEQDAYRLGFLQGLKKMVGGADITSDAARVAGLLKPNQLARFKEVFPDQKSYAAFVDNLEKEQQMFQTRSAVFSNSTTAKQLEHLKDDPSLGQQAVETAVNVKTGGMASLARALAKLTGPKPMKEDTASAVAAILTNLDQTGLDEVSQRLADAYKRRVMSKALGAVARPAAAEAAYRSGESK